MSTRAYLAVDLGAESGRVIVGTLDAERLELHEAHRFAIEPMRSQDVLCWDVAHIWGEILAGLRAAGSWARDRGVRIVSVGVDCWGVDFVLLDARGEVISPPRCYRDARHESGLELVGERIGFERLYGITGIRAMALNTLSQLAGAIAAGDNDVRRADRLLLLPDYFHFLLSGEAGNEASIASTTQMLDAATGDWSAEILSAIGVPDRLFHTPYPPGRDLGGLKAEIAAATGLEAGVRVVAPGSHDTASAVAGVPSVAGGGGGGGIGGGESWAYLSSGTWSLMGAERATPILSRQAREAGFTNERGVAGTFRFHKNLVGLWLVQELRRDLERDGTQLNYSQLTDAAAAAPGFRTRIDPSDPSLLAPGVLIAKIRLLARNAGDPEPRTPGEFTRCCLESLAMAYRACLEDLEAILREDGAGRENGGDGPDGVRLETIHVVGGGSKNALLNQMTADATGRRVLVGPAEATAAGNILVQAMTDGQARDLAGIREIVARSFEVVEYHPRDAARWSAEYKRYRETWETNR